MWRYNYMRRHPTALDLSDFSSCFHRIITCVGCSIGWHEMPIPFFSSLTHQNRVSALILYNVWNLLFCKNVWSCYFPNTNCIPHLTSKLCSDFMNSRRVFCVPISVVLIVFITIQCKPCFLRTECVFWAEKTPVLL